MKNEFSNNELEVIKKFQKKGYIGNYMVRNKKLIDLKTKVAHSPKNVKIVAEHRFEGMSNPSDMSILYVLETTYGGKGTVLANYSPASDIETAEFFKEIPKGNYLG